MNGKIIGETIEDVASSISNSKWAKSIIPTVDELNKTIADNSKLSRSLHDENIHRQLKSMFTGINIPEEEASRMAKTVKSKNYEQAINELSEDISKYTDKPVDKVLERAKSITEKELSRKVDINEAGIGGKLNATVNKVIKYPQAYFMNPDKSIRDTRIGTAVGAYAGLAIGGRYLQGGTLTTDQYGRKDIAGIPFL